MADWTVSGFISTEPEVRTIPSGKRLVEFTIADKKNKGKPNEKTNWIRVTTWENQREAFELAQTFHKGDFCKATGLFDLREFQAKTGEMKYSLDFAASKLESLAPPGKGASHIKHTAQDETKPPLGVVQDDDGVPF